MSTTPFRCPGCGVFLRVPVQISTITKYEDNMLIEFDNQTLAHVCKKEDK